MSNYINSSAFLFGNTIATNEETIKFESIESIYKDLVEEKRIEKIQFWKRFNITAKAYAISSLFAINNSNIKTQENIKKKFAIIGSSPYAAIKDNINYYKDYLDNNKESSRGNLFVYTLPTVPLGELSIIFKFIGPTLFIGFSKNIIQNAFYHCAIMLETYNIEGILLLMEDDSGIGSLVISKEREFSLGSKVFLLDDFANSGKSITSIKGLSNFLYEK